MYHGPRMKPPAPRIRVRPPSWLAVVVALAIGCGSPPPAPAPAPSGPGFAMNLTETQPGARVLVEQGGQWLPATIVQRVGTDLFQVRLDGQSPELDRVVGPDRMRPAATAAPDAAGLRPGEPVLVATPTGGLYLAEVVQLTPGAAVRVKYDGFSPEVVEDVEPARVRRPHTGPATHAPGSEVTVEVDGVRASGRVAAVVSPETYLVRFAQAGPSYDRVFPESAIQAVAGAAPASTASPASPPPAASPSPAAPSGGAALAAGDAVYVEHRGAHHLATVSRWSGRTATVRYERGGETEEVDAARVMRVPAEKTAGVAWAPKDPVFIEWHGMFFRGHVLEKKGPGQYKVRFDGMGPAEDEIVVARRLRPAR